MDASSTCVAESLVVGLPTRSRADTRSRWWHAAGLSTLVMLFCWNIWNWQRNIHLAVSSVWSLSVHWERGQGAQFSPELRAPLTVDCILGTPPRCQHYAITYTWIISTPGLCPCYITKSIVWKVLTSVIVPGPATCWAYKISNPLIVWARIYR